MSENLFVNSKATHDYDFKSKLEAGVKLLGQEVKAIKEGKGSFTGSYIKPIKGKLFAIGLNIPQYSKSSDSHYKPTRSRELLFRDYEIKRIVGLLSQKGFSCIPLRLYLKNNLVKLEVGVGKAKKKYEKKEVLKKRQQERDMERRE